MNFQHPRIAVVSMAGIFPGAGDTAQFIDNILNKREAIGPVPAHRWAAPPERMVAKAGPLPDRAASDRAGLITDFTFDPAGFDLAPDLLSSLDPVHHLVLCAGRTAMEGCVIPADLLDRTGIILAAIALPTENASLLAEKLLCRPDPGPLHPYEALGATVVGSPAALLARATGCRGGSFTLDAACASSLFSIKLACEHLLSGRADMMVAGGVSRPDSLYTQVGFTQLAALSPSGRCAPFDADADGLVVGEGTGIVVLKRLEDAVAHGDTIHGVITGWGVSNDIEGNLVAPASEGQMRAMQAAYGMAGWSLSDIQYMECHGSGTPKGDQVELTSIATLARSFGCPDHPLAIGSVKSTVGHLLTAAGAAGFIKTLMAMEAATLPPSLNFSRLPDNSPALKTGIRVQAEAAPWQPSAEGLPRRAGISAFGFGGINAHLLVESYEGGPCPVRPSAVSTASTGKTFRPPPCAVVGMAVLGPGMTTPEDLDQILSGGTQRPTPPGPRWRNPLAAGSSGESAQGLYMDALTLDLKDFHIPPNQFPDILAQHLVMLKAARESLLDAGINPRPDGDDPRRLHMGAALGIDFDFGAADFSLRWHHHRWEDGLRDRLSPPLTFDRTLGALGGIVASRIAREFKLGGPCFTLSAGAASGFKALETALISLGTGETDIFLCGAVDMAGDLCTHFINRALGEFDHGHLPSEGAAALVVKRLDRATQDNDRIYAVIHGTGGAGGDRLSVELSPQDAPDRPTSLSFQRALETAGTSENGVGQAVGPCPETRTGIKKIETKNWTAGAADGLFSLAAACRLATATQGEDRASKPGMIAVGCTTWDGASAHVILGPPPFSSDSTGKGNPEKNSRKKSTAGPRAPITLPVAKPQIPEEVICRLHSPATERVNGPEPIQDLGTERMSAADLLMEIHEATTRVHEHFLDLSSRNLAEMGRQLAALADAQPIETSDPYPETAPIQAQGESQTGDPAAAAASAPPQAFLNRAQCLEYARGKAGNVLGPAFDIIDTYPVRVRLPNEPLMLVDRIMEIEGEMLSLTKGKIITQHDVLENAWYLDGGKAPVSISIEAGQADLFLCAWLGIDHVVKGTRKYRLLDAKVTFHRPLPDPGETIEYHIEIDRFLRQGEIYLFFFHYKGYIDGLPFISMRDGCAGFFTEEEVKNSGGIILKKEDTAPVHSGSAPESLVPMAETALSDHQVEALRCGDLQTAFGPLFKGVVPARPQWLPGGPMTLIHRVLALEPIGGRFGLGRILAEADIHPDDWFLTCHFIDDMVMPGTLMYECCAHALRIFVQRMGWISTKAAAHYDVLPANESDLKCRGPVTPKTRKARYEIEIKEIGYGPEPFVRADAHMFSDDLRIVLYKDMGMKLAGVNRQDLMAFWRDR